MKFYEMFFTKHYQNYGKLCPPIVVDLETILVSCPLIVDNMFFLSKRLSGEQLLQHKR